jgi:hypothetical protein
LAAGLEFFVVELVLVFALVDFFFVEAVVLELAGLLEMLSLDFALVCARLVVANCDASNAAQKQVIKLRRDMLTADQSFFEASNDCFAVKLQVENILIPLNKVHVNYMLSS